MRRILTLGGQVQRDPRAGPVTPNVRANRAPTAGHQARAGGNVPCTTRPSLPSRRWPTGPEAAKQRMP